MNGLKITEELLILRDLQEKYDLSIIAQKEAFEAQKGQGERSELACIAAAATRECNNNRRKYESAVYDFYKRR
jgi:hypothetical protein